jgi:hypothetical protein
MPITIEQIKAELTAEEPDYSELVKNCGSEALPVLLKIVDEAQSDVMVVAKATYLASLLEPLANVNAKASDVIIRSTEGNALPVVKVAAAAAAGNVKSAELVSVLVDLLNTDDRGIQRTALAALRGWPVALPQPLVTAIESGAKQQNRDLNVRTMFAEALARLGAAGGAGNAGPTTESPPPPPPPPPTTSPAGFGAGHKRPFVRGEGDGWGSVKVDLGRKPRPLQ